MNTTFNKVKCIQDLESVKKQLTEDNVKNEQLYFEFIDKYKDEIEFKEVLLEDNDLLEYAQLIVNKLYKQQHSIPTTVITERIKY